MAKRKPDERKPGAKRRPKAPLWARLCAVFGCVLMVAGGGAVVGTQVLVARYTGAVDQTSLLGGSSGDDGEQAEASEIDEGPLNILLVGIDPRSDDQAPRSDSILVVHVNKDMDAAQVFSIPRDLYVDIPAFEKSGFLGGSAKINAAMSYGSNLGNGKHSTEQGFELLAKTVSQLTGIEKFDAGVILDFNGFKDIVAAMDGVTMTIDQEVKSEHLQPNGKGREKSAACQNGGCDHPYIGPQKVYKKGTYHLQAWEALDYVRQRYGLPNGDYDRQRHQQQFIRAIAEQALSKDVVTDPVKLDKVLTAAGKSLTFDGGGHDVLDWAIALRGINPDDLTLIKLPGGGLFDGETYLGEQLEDTAPGFFKSVKSDTVTSYVIDHPEFLQSD